MQSRSTKFHNRHTSNKSNNHSSKISFSQTQRHSFTVVVLLDLILSCSVVRGSAAFGVWSVGRRA